MVHHKRKRPKNRRAGCLMCKPWKVNGVGKYNRCVGKFKFSESRRICSCKEQVSDHAKGKTASDHS
jgi:hypothetical protein